MGNVTFLKPKIDTFERYIPAVHAILQNDRLSYFEIKNSLVNDKHFIEIFNVLDMLKQELYTVASHFWEFNLDVIVNIEIAKDDPSDAYPTVMVQLAFDTFVIAVRGFPLSGELTREGYIKGKVGAPDVTTEPPFHGSDRMLELVAAMLTNQAIVNQGGWRVDSDKQVSYVAVEPRETHVQALCLHLLNL